MSEPTSAAPAARAAPPELARMSDEHLAKLERLDREETENHGPTWIAERFRNTPDGLVEWYVHTPWEDEGTADQHCSAIATDMWEETATLAAAARNALPSLIAEVRAGRAEAGKLREQIERLTRYGRDRDDLLARASAAEASAARLRERVGELSEALTALLAATDADWFRMAMSGLAPAVEQCHAINRVRIAARAALRAETKPPAATRDAGPCQHALRDDESLKCRHGLFWGTTCDECIAECSKCAAMYGRAPAPADPATPEDRDA